MFDNLDDATKEQILPLKTVNRKASEIVSGSIMNWEGTRRLDDMEAMSVLITLCWQHQWKSAVCSCISSVMPEFIQLFTHPLICALHTRSCQGYACGPISIKAQFDLLYTLCSQCAFAVFWCCTNFMFNAAYHCEAMQHCL